MDINKFCNLYIPSDSRDKAKKELRRMLRLYEEEKKDLEHETEHVVILSGKNLRRYERWK